MSADGPIPLPAPDALLRQLCATLPLKHGYRLLAPAERWYALGDSLARAGRLEAGLAAFLQARRLDATWPAPSLAAASLLNMLKRPRAALDMLESLPASADFLAARADLRLTRQQADLALALCDQALSETPGHFAAALNRGAALRALRRFDAVLTNDANLAGRHPEQATARYNHADALLIARRHEASLIEFDAALRLAPGYPQARMGKALTLTMLQRFDEADTLFRDVRMQHPAAYEDYLRNAGDAIGLPDSRVLPVDARVIFLAWTMLQQVDCDWTGRPAVETLLTTRYAEPEPTTVYEPSLAFHALLFDVAPLIQRHVAGTLAREAERRAGTWTIERRPAVFTPPPGTRRRLRVGFLSPDFREHPVADCHWRQLQLHDRTRFEIHAYSLHDAPDSPWRQRIVDAADHFAEVSTLPAQAIAQRIAADGIDILVDLSGYTAHTRPEILAARPAPLQVQHMGTPCSAEAGFIDYRLTDRIVNPPDEPPWRESFVWLPDTFWLADETLSVAAPPSRRECSLPESAFVFCCFNTHQKLEPTVFAVWMRLLTDLPDSVLWLTWGSERSRAALRSAASAAGIDSKRLIFAPRLPMDQHLARHRCADLFLDTFIYNAHVTALNSWWAGLPVLTCRGEQMAARMGASAALALDMSELVTHSRADYEQRALHLARNPGELDALRRRLAEKIASTPLFQTEQRVRDIESAYEQMWRRHAQGLAPVSFAVAR